MRKYINRSCILQIVSDKLNELWQIILEQKSVENGKCINLSAPVNAGVVPGIRSRKCSLNHRTSEFSE